ncbi:hypothetical protein ElyMa_004627600 [Elysia marginata]|uniref:Uncharacterized protein n=1 Tax=Elysia marginata TaxID=1093978 RepID=A0AAV4HZ95_9GAST|nr:hypothetical protein ElyMa_004627600 [Elysia marginata]
MSNTLSSAAWNVLSDWLSRQGWSVPVGLVMRLTPFWRPEATSLRCRQMSDIITLFLIRSNVSNLKAKATVQHKPSNVQEFVSSTSSSSSNSSSSSSSSSSKVVVVVVVVVKVIVVVVVVAVAVILVVIATAVAALVVILVSVVVVVAAAAVVVVVVVVGGGGGGGGGGVICTTRLQHHEKLKQTLENINQYVVNRMNSLDFRHDGH